MSGIYLGVLSLVAGSILVTMTILADTMFPKGDGNRVGTSSSSSFGSRDYETRVSPNKWVNQIQRHNWLFGAGGIAAMAVGIFLVWSSINMRKAKIIALKGGLLGLLWSAFLGWLTWHVYDDREYDRVGMMATHAILFLTATVLLSLAGLFSNLKPQETGALIFVATGIFVVALVLGSRFALTEFSGIGVPILLVPSALFTVVAGSALAFTARVEHLPR